MSGVDIFDAVVTLLALIGYVAAAVLAVLGWLRNRPDSSGRFMLRVWTWLTLGASIFLIDISLDDTHWSWWHYLWLLLVFYGIYSAVQINWKKAEACRQFERAVAGHRPSWTIK